MMHFTRLLLATVCLLTFTGYAGANSVQKMADTPKAQQISVVHFGKPLDCKVDNCPKKKEEVAAPAPVTTDKPLIDAYGMPTNMPAQIRGSDPAQQVTVSAPRKPKPVTPAADATSGDAAPVDSTQTSAAASEPKPAAKAAKASTASNPDKIATE